MKRAAKSLLAALGALAATAAPAYAQGAEPAGGAAIGEIAIATTAAPLLTAALLHLGTGHRSGRVKILGALAAPSPSASPGLPGWAALPSAIAGVSLMPAVFGMYWDISLHIDVGRDDGPLANPAHYFILAGLFGIFSAGFVAMVLPKRSPGPTAIRIARDWEAPLGGVLICACGAFALHGVPARRPLAPPVRAGRDAVGPDPPDADRRRVDDAGGHRGAARRGPARQPRSAAAPTARWGG